MTYCLFTWGVTTTRYHEVRKCPANLRSGVVFWRRGEGEKKNLFSRVGYVGKRWHDRRLRYCLNSEQFFALYLWLIFAVLSVLINSNFEQVDVSSAFYVVVSLDHFMSYRNIVYYNCYARDYSGTWFNCFICNLRQGVYYYSSWICRQC